MTEPLSKVSNLNRQHSRWRIVEDELGTREDQRRIWNNGRDSTHSVRRKEARARDRDCACGRLQEGANTQKARHFRRSRGQRARSEED